jgi:hypothetical protein
LPGLGAGRRDGDLHLGLHAPCRRGTRLFALLGGDDPQAGFWSVELEDRHTTRQHYVRNTAVLVTRHEDGQGNAVEVVDFCPRFQRDGRTYRPTAWARIVRPLTGSPRIRVRLRVGKGWGGRADETAGSNHVRYLMAERTLRLSTDAPVGRVQGEQWFRLERPLHFFLGPDEGFVGHIAETVAQMRDRTVAEWRHWSRGLATPVEWQDVVIRSAITLKLCQHEETGAIVAALTTSLPEHADSGRNWDYRYCWIRDAYYTVQALNRLGALDVLEGYLEYLRNIVDGARGRAHPAALRRRRRSAADRAHRARLPGYRGMGPVRFGNQAYEQIQHDAYGQIVLSDVQAFFDQRLFRPSGPEDFRSLERVGERAWAVYDKPDAGPLGAPHQVRRAHLFGRHVLGGVRSSRQRRRGAGTGGPPRLLGRPRGRDARPHRGSGLARGHRTRLRDVRRRRPRRQPHPTPRPALLRARRPALPVDARRRRAGPAPWQPYAPLRDRGRFRAATRINVCTSG